MGMLPGIAKMKDQINSANLDDRMIKRQRAIILSMTREERRNPDVLKASRKKRIAAGSGTRVEDVNRLLKQHRQMADMMKAMGGMKRGAMGKMAQMFGLGGGGGMGGMPQPTPEQIEALQKQMGGGMPGGMPAGLPPMPGGLPQMPKDFTPPPGAFNLPKMPAGIPGLPGLGSGKLPGLGGFNPFGKKK
jgi:signal recognition particle subunit SRP54